MSDPEPDAHFFVVKGRRWRREDPHLPDEVSAQLRSHLGKARNAVRTTKRDGDETALLAARDRVGIAKHGLGERGTPWWEQSETERRERWQQALDQLAD